MNRTAEDDENRLMQGMSALTLSPSFNSFQTRPDVAFGIRDEMQIFQLRRKFLER